MSRVIERVVRRFYYRGKGYATKSRAYIEAAKDELKADCFGPRDEHGWREFDFEAYKEKLAQMFPVVCTCSPYEPCSCDTLWFDNHKYRAWLKARALDLSEIDRLQPELLRVAG